MEKQDKVAKILAWRECLSKLPDNHFFELMRMYLGEIKTPYNKQNLTESLSAFLRKEETQKCIISLLSNNEILVLTSIKLLPKATETKLKEIFSNKFSATVLDEMLLNLEERLVIFRQYADKDVFFDINPLLEESVSRILSVEKLLPSVNLPFNAESDSFSLTQLFLSSIYSFLSFEKDIYKADNTFKKRANTLLNDIFHENAKIIKDFLVSLKNLSLITQNDSEVTVQRQKWLSFAQLDDFSQYCYIVTAACGFYTRRSLSRFAQILSEILLSFPENKGYTRNILFRKIFLLVETHLDPSESSLSKSRFAKMIQMAKQSEPEETSSEKEDFNIQKIIDFAVEFGLIKKTTVNGEDVFFVKHFETNEYCENIMSIDAGFAITILPGAPLSKLIPLMDFLSVTNYETIAQFEITKKSCINGFDFNNTDETIIEKLSSFSSYEISQNLIFSIKDWFKSYNSVSLYKGYVLKADEEKEIIIENSKEISGKIIKKLAKGIYLLNFENDDEASFIFDKIGLDSVGKVYSKKSDYIAADFKKIIQKKICLEEKYISDFYNKAEDIENIQKDFSSQLEKIDSSKEKLDVLSRRIERKIIITKEQLKPESVRLEKCEAIGMDYSGKIRIVENAILSESILEITYDDAEKSFYRGFAKSVQKQNADAIVELEIEGTSEIKVLSLSHAKLVKRIPGAIFKEKVSSK